MSLEYGPRLSTTHRPNPFHPSTLALNRYQIVPRPHPQPLTSTSDPLTSALRQMPSTEATLDPHTQNPNPRPNASTAGSGAGEGLCDGVQPGLLTPTALPSNF